MHTLADVVQVKAECCCDVQVFSVVHIFHKSAWENPCGFLQMLHQQQIINHKDKCVGVFSSDFLQRTGPHAHFKVSRRNPWKPRHSIGGTLRMFRFTEGERKKKNPPHPPPAVNPSIVSVAWKVNKQTTAFVMENIWLTLGECDWRPDRVSGHQTTSCCLFKPSGGDGEACSV